MPIDAFSATERGLSFGATCTLYRDRFSAIARPGEPIPAGDILEYRNDRFFDASASGTGATFSRAAGVSGSWLSNAEHSYTTAWPFGFSITSSERSFSLADHQLSAGNIGAGTLSFDYARQIDPLNTNTFSGSFNSLDILPGGAISGAISSAAVLNWSAFDLPDTSVNFSLYAPAIVTASPPARAWVVSAGAAGSGVAGNGRNNPGLNAFDRDIGWSVCPNLLPSNVTFSENDGSRVDLYIRRSGVSGRVDFTPDPEISTRVSGYDTAFSRFAHSWLSNLGLESGIAGRFVLPYPADISLDFDSLLLDAAGCIDSGTVLPERKELAYWHLGLIPLSVDLRPETLSINDMWEARSRNFRLWITGDYEIPHLNRAEGRPSDLVELEASFAPDGNFLDSEIYADEVVYALDGFYTVLKDLRLSDYPSREAPAWDPQVTIQARRPRSMALSN